MEEADQEKPEKPTAFKLRRAREKGMVARGGDLGILGVIGAFLGYAWIFGPRHMAAFAEASRRTFAAGGSASAAPHDLPSAAGPLFGAVLTPLLVLGGIVFALGLALQLAQTGFLFTAHPLKPDLGRLNPAKGLKRVFSLRTLVETAKNILKMAAYSAIAYLVLRHALNGVARSIADGRGLAEAMTATLLLLVLYATGAAALFAALDQAIVRRDFMKQMRMSRREARRELRDREGDPRQKQRRRQLHSRFVAMSESLRNLRGADVLIVNPDHYAIGLRYQRERMAAPLVVARGTQHFAQRLKRVAFVYGVTTVTAPALARELYRWGGFKQEIPDRFYREVADIYRRLDTDGRQARSSA